MSVYAGIDVHRKRSQVAVVTGDGTVELSALPGSMLMHRPGYSLMVRSAKLGSLTVTAQPFPSFW